MILEFQPSPAPIKNPGQAKTECVKAGWLDQFAVTDPRPFTLLRLCTAEQALERAESGQPDRLLQAAVPVQMQTARPDEENRESAGVKESYFCKIK